MSFAKNATEFEYDVLGRQTKVTLPDTAFTTMAYGFEDSHYDSMRVVGHGGGFPGINARLDMYLELGYSVAVMSNYDPSAAEGISSHLRKLIAGIALVQPITLEDPSIRPLLGKYKVEGGPFPDLVLRIAKEKEEIIARFPAPQS